MEAIIKEHDRLESKANLSRVVGEVDTLLEDLKRTRAALAQNAAAAPQLLEAQTKQATAQFDKMSAGLKDIYGALGKYGKALEKKFKDQPVGFAEKDTLAPHSPLVNRAIAMHLLREGHFEVAATFIAEANARHETTALSPVATMDIDGDEGIANGHRALVDQLATPHPDQTRREWQADFEPNAYEPDSLHQQFQDMYEILNALRVSHDLEPAIQWARAHSSVLEARGSNLEYELCELQYVNLFQTAGPAAALAYARQTFRNYPTRYAGRVQRLIGALAFLPDISSSPYAELFTTTKEDSMSTAAAAFTAEFCALLSLSSASPLFTAVTAGCIALPTLLKLSQIQASHRTSWTTASELPVEIPLPPAYNFHSIFVCPVSKEQSTDANPPMMLPCAHVICRESLDRVSRGGRFKCPYCPLESHKNDAKRVFV